MGFKTTLAGLTAKQMLASILVVGIGISGLGYGTYAYFEDTDSASGNTIQAGTIDIKINGSDTQSGMFSLTNAQPTDTVAQNFSVSNAGTTAADHLQLGLAFAENDAGEPADPDLANNLTASGTAAQIEVTEFHYIQPNGNTWDIDANVTDANGNGIVDLADVQNSAELDNLQPPAENSGNTGYATITLQVANDDGSFTGTDEDIMGDGIDITVDFSLMQDSSQN